MDGGAWLERRLASRKGLAPSTVREERRLARIINEAFGGTSLEDLTPMQIRAWVDGLEYSHRTQLMVLRVLRTALDEAVALELISRNPAAPIKLQRKPRQTTPRRGRSTRPCGSCRQTAAVGSTPST